MRTYLSDNEGKPIELPTCNVKRIIPLEEVRLSSYEDMVDLANIFNHDIIEDLHGTWRWKRNMLTNWMHAFAPVYMPSILSTNAEGIPPYCKSTNARASIDLNNLWLDYSAKVYSMEELMKYYMQIGYSLCGYSEVFEQRTAKEFKLPDALPEETIIVYMSRYHAGKVLRL